MEIHGEKEHHWDVIDDHLKEGNNFSSSERSFWGPILNKSFGSDQSFKFMFGATLSVYSIGNLQYL